MPDPSTKPRRRRLLRFGMRGLMLAVLVIGGGLGWFVHEVRVQREAVAAILRAGGTFGYDISDRDYDPKFRDHVEPGGRPRSQLPPWWLWKALGPDYLGYVNFVAFGGDHDRFARVDDALMARIGRLPRLAYLGIGNNRGVTGVGLARLGRLSGLLNLDLSHTGIQGPDLVHLRTMIGLELLTLPEDISDADLAHIAGLKSLWQLNLVSTRITDAGLVHLARLPNLSDLKLRCPGVKGPGLAYLRGSTALEVLDLDGSGVDDLAALAPLPNLRILSLRGTPLDDSGIARLPDLPDLGGRVSLSDTRIGDAGLARVALCGDLGWLELDGTWITDAGLAEFAWLRSMKYRGLDPLETLDLRRTKLTDASLPTLRSMPGLVQCSLEGTAITPAGLAAFEASLPPGYEVRP